MPAVSRSTSAKQDHVGWLGLDASERARTIARDLDDMPAPRQHLDDQPHHIRFVVDLLRLIGHLDGVDRRIS